MELTVLSFAANFTVALTSRGQSSSIPLTTLSCAAIKESKQRRREWCIEWPREDGGGWTLTQGNRYITHHGSPPKNVAFFVWKNSFYLILKIFLKIIMVSIHFCPPPVHRLRTSETVLDCKLFQQSMSGFPSDRHAYNLKCAFATALHPWKNAASLWEFLNLIRGASVHQFNWHWMVKTQATIDKHW